jgi:hypothetical protein
MTKGKKLILILAVFLILGLINVKADFSYEESYDTYTRQYDTWVYDIDVDDEDTKIIVKHLWSSPRYGYDYDTESDREWEYGPTMAEDRRIPFRLNSPLSSSYDIGRELVNSFSRNNYYSGYYSYRRNSWGFGNYYRGYW